MKNLAGQTVWITGASSGIGEALSYAFAGKGARLILSARRMEELEKVKSRCLGAEQVELLALDLSILEELPQKVEWVFAKMGGLDILVNNAGLSQRCLAIESSSDVYRRIMEVNFFGTMELSRLVLARFIRQNEGLFVVISSMAGKIGLPQRTAYCASKFALEGFFSSLKTETWKTPIRYLMVRPGSIKTHIAENALSGNGRNFSRKDPFIEKGMLPENLARSIMRAIEKNKTELFAGSAKERLAIALNTYLPGLLFHRVKRIGS